ncbi:hypothetical protein L3Q82_002826 [Scortum barcoo]|uniref:Uncharacterized protein n=1 Tax=Scortum barcoo TaxID=214431 RepID=A0ACB8VUQ9_9TELE|nr:hypothetical protein L3Q82_002826 [Scortum barcoo]
MSSNLMDEFNPSLQKLVSLGNSYVHAFQALAVTSEAYFSALSKIGERALHSMSSRSLGDVLIQISESQRRLTMELEGVFRWFSVEVLQMMDNNVRLDIDFISGSRKRYEMEVHSQAAALERQLRRGANQDCSDYMQFLRDSHCEALEEEERRHRFLAEKHCGLIESIAHLMNKLGGSLQQRADGWTDKVSATRGPVARRPTSVHSVGMREEEIRKSREEMNLGSVPSRAPSPLGGFSRSGADSVGGGGGDGERSMRAKVAHQPGGSNPTLLPFARGEMITVMVPQPRNGWLYGRTDSSSRSSVPRSSSSSSMSNLLNQPGGSSHGGGGPPPPPPPPQSLTSNKQSEKPPITSTPGRRVESTSEDKGSKPHGSRPELFPRLSDVIQGRSIF